MREERVNIHLISAGILLTCLGSAQADTFRWFDNAGNVHYGDVPAEEAKQIEQKKFGRSPSSDDAALPYETRLAKKKFPVTLYVTDNCGNPCLQARDFLNKRGIPFTENKLTTKEDIDAFTLKSKSNSVPTLLVGTTNWFKNFETVQWSSELDNAGYPKIAPYRPQTPPSRQKDTPAVKN